MSEKKDKHEFFGILKAAFIMTFVSVTCLLIYTSMYETVCTSQAKIKTILSTDLGPSRQAKVELEDGNITILPYNRLSIGETICLNRETRRKF